jgi:sec-independent protein translocase protein TatC
MATAEVGALSDKNEKNEPESEEGSMTLWEHLEELRGRIVRMLVAFLVGAIACWIYREELLVWVTLPYQEAYRAGGHKGLPELHSGTPGAAFFAYIHLSVLAGFLFALPIVLYQLWAFVAPGLYSREKKFTLPFVISSCLLFIGGGYFGWKFAFPKAFAFLLQFNKELPGMSLKDTWMIGDYLDFCTRLLLAFGATAELPVLASFLAVAGLVTHHQLIKFFRYFVVIAFVIAAIITPPDPMSQIMMAVPLIGLYGVSILVVWGITKGRERRAAKADKADKADKGA